MTQLSSNFKISKQYKKKKIKKFYSFYNLESFKQKKNLLKNSLKTKRNKKKSISLKRKKNPKVLYAKTLKIKSFTFIRKKWSIKNF